MASLAYGWSGMEFMAIDADAHRGYARRLGHDRHVGYLAVTRLTLYAGFQVFAVRPVHSHSESVNTHPWDGLSRLGQRGELLDRGFLGGNCGVAGHARTRRRKSHQAARLRIGVAGRALQTQCQVRLMAVHDGLGGWRVVGRIVGHFFNRVHSCCRLLRLRVGRVQQQRRSY